MKINIKLIDNKLEFFDELSKLNNVTIEEMVLNFIDDKLNSIILLEHGFYYDKIAKRLFTSNNQIVKLSNYEELLFDLLINNLNEFVTIENIFNHIWGKEVSIFTLRNIIKKIRDKTYYEIIFNKNSYGYKIKEGKKEC